MKQRSIIRDIWLGNLSESEHLPTSPEYRCANDAADCQRGKLERELSECQKELLECYTDAMYHLGSIYAEDAFACGVALGMKLVFEAIT